MFVHLQEPEACEAVSGVKKKKKKKAKKEKDACANSAGWADLMESSTNKEHNGAEKEARKIKVSCNTPFFF